MGTVYLFMRNEFVIVLALLMILVRLLFVCLVGWFVLVLISCVGVFVCSCISSTHATKAIAKSSNSRFQKQCAIAANKQTNNKQMAKHTLNVASYSNAHCFAKHDLYKFTKM